MARINPRERDPERYERIKKAQQELQSEYDAVITMARICPFCDNKVEILYKGSHGASTIRCNSCGEPVFFPPVCFRIIFDRRTVVLISR